MKTPNPSRAAFLKRNAEAFEKLSLTATGEAKAIYQTAAEAVKAEASDPSRAATRRSSKAVKRAVEAQRS